MIKQYSFLLSFCLFLAISWHSRVSFLRTKEERILKISSTLFIQEVCKACKTEFENPVFDMTEIYLKRRHKSPCITLFDHPLFSYYPRYIHGYLHKVTKRCEFSIISSLYKSLSRHRFPKNLMQEIVGAIGSVINLQRDLQKKDLLQVLYEVYVNPQGKEERFGHIQAVRIISKKKITTLYRFIHKKKLIFFNKKGQSAHKGFLKAPLDYKKIRIGSRFSARRFHPILKRFKKHEGVDYPAPAGTKVLAAADGKIVAARYERGYGNVVKIKHSNGRQTLYGHLQYIAKGIRPGKFIKGGTKLGGVGRTGLATGNHLHFGMIVGRKFVDPLKQPTILSLTLSGKELIQFKYFVKHMNDAFKRPIDDASPMAYAV